MIHIICPANVATGGPELLHQLGYKLNLLGFQAKMMYLNASPNADPACEPYKKYNVPWSIRLTPAPDDFIIVPELCIPLLPQLHAYKCAVWWLSVNNAIYDDPLITYMQNQENLFHFAQSYYAINHLKNNLHIASEKIYHLSDYLNSEFFLHEPGSDSTGRENIVLFNPKKGFKNTSELISRSDYRIKWQALSGLTPFGMRETLKKAKIYIDFGAHPGKDRIPREAAMCGCCVLTNRQGAAAYREDVPLPETYKFSEQDSDSYILSHIYKLLEEYDTRKNDYADYISGIKREYMVFEKEILDIFTQICDYPYPCNESPEYYQDLMLSSIEKGDYKDAYTALLLYRKNLYEESVDLDIIETIIRTEIGEYAEAKISVERGLAKDPHNYELSLYAAQLHLLLGNHQISKQYCEDATLYSRGTADEAQIKISCDEILNQINA